MHKQYKITNNTVRPVRLDKDGKDVRTVLEKVGHSVRFVDNNERQHTLYQNRFSIITGLNAGILGLQRGGFIHIEEIKNLAHALREHALGAETKHKPVKTERRANVVEMGKEIHKEESLSVKASNKSKRNKRRGGVDAAEQGSDETAGEG